MKSTQILSDKNVTILTNFWQHDVRTSDQWWQVERMKWEGWSLPYLHGRSIGNKLCCMNCQLSCCHWLLILFVGLIILICEARTQHSKMASPAKRQNINVWVQWCLYDKNSLSRSIWQMRGNKACAPLVPDMQWITLWSNHANNMTLLAWSLEATIRLWSTDMQSRLNLLYALKFSQRSPSSKGLQLL